MGCGFSNTSAAIRDPDFPSPDFHSNVNSFSFGRMGERVSLKLSKKIGVMLTARIVTHLDSNLRGVNCVELINLKLLNSACSLLFIIVIII